MTNIDEAALSRLGYSVTWFRDARGCVVWNEDETWVGEGSDGDCALADAVRRLLPCRAAREAVQLMLAMAAPPSEPTDDTGQDPVAPVVVPAASPPEVTPATSTLDQASETPDGTHATPPPPAPAPVREPLTAAGEIAEIEKRVDDAEDDLPRLAPDIQRLTIFVWLARARSIQDRDANVAGWVAVLARRLGGFARTYWPGTIPVLQRAATPQRAVRGMSTSRELEAATPESWAAAATLVERVLIERTSSPNYDDGWCDGRFATAEDADELVAQAADAIEASLAPSIEEMGDGALTQLVDAARKLRFARVNATDGRRWGALVGRLRAFASRERQIGAPLVAVLDAAYAPKVGWPAELAGRARPPLARRDAEVLVRGADSTEKLAEALVGTFDTLDTDALAGLLSDRRADVDRLQARQFSDRRGRRRLAALRARLGLDARQEELADDLSAPDAPADEPAHVRHDRRSELAAALRMKLGQGRALFVSNREDPPLRARIAETFSLDVEWCVADPRRVEAACGRIERGSYDVVLSATGFQEHATDIALSRASRSARALYVRVNRGRIGACERALARELGLHLA